MNKEKVNTILKIVRELEKELEDYGVNEIDVKIASDERSRISVVLNNHIFNYDYDKIHEYFVDIGFIIEEIKAVNNNVILVFENAEGGK